MSKDIIEEIQEQFNYFPHKINMYIINNFNDDRKNMQHNVLKVLVNFHVKTHNRWIEAEKKYKATSIYELP